MKNDLFLKHIFAWTGFVCMIFGIIVISVDCMHYVNSDEVSCQIIRTEHEVKEAGSPNKSWNNYSTYVDYSYNGVTYNESLIKENCGLTGQTVKLFVDKSNPTKLYQFSLHNLLFRIYILITGLLLIVVDVVIHYPLRLAVPRETHHICG